MDAQKIDTITLGGHALQLFECGEENGLLTPGRGTGEMSEHEDQFRDLLEQVQSGSEDATCELIELYGPHIVRVIRRRLGRKIRAKFDSVDFVQAVWASFFASPKPVTDFKDPGELIAYLAALAQHKVVDEVRRRLDAEKYDVKREQSLEDSRWDLREELHARQASPSQEAVAEELWRRMLQGKPEHYKQILQLRREGNTYPQIAEQVGVNEKTARRIVKSLLPESD